MLRVVSVPGRGRGVRTTSRIARGRLVERSPVVFVRKGAVDRTSLAFYVYALDSRREMLALGLGSLFNHSREPSLRIAWRPKTRELLFFAARAIRAGEELTIDYGYEPPGYDGG